MTSPATLWLFIISVACLLSSTSAQACGNGIREAGEDCDYGGGAGCSGTCTCLSGWAPDTVDTTNLSCLKLCGDGVLDSGEECDDGNTAAFDGCSVDCLIENCVNRPMGTVPCQDSPLPWDCTAGMLCTAHCGDGKVLGTEVCDSSVTGCAACACTMGYEPTSPPSTQCQKICGNGVINAGEQCDSGYKCDTDCTCVFGYQSTTPVSNICTNNCGDNNTAAPEEECDGSPNCLANCKCDSANGFPPSTGGLCGAKCGDGIMAGSEQCDGGANCKADCTCVTGYTPQTNNTCTLISYCTKYPVDPTMGNCTDDVNQRTVSCVAGYYAAAPSTPSTIIVGDLPGACTDINECDLYGCNAPADPSGVLVDANSCTDSTSAGASTTAPNTRSCQCGAGNYAVQAGTPIDTKLLTGNAPFGGCAATCGNGVIDPMEECDDTDNCTIACTCNAGYEVTTPVSLYCQPICGNGKYDSTNGEECDSGLGCDADCQCELGFETVMTTECVDIDECTLYDQTNVLSCSNDVVPNNQATIECQEGYYAVLPDVPKVTLVGGEPWTGCQDISECTAYGPPAGSPNVLSCDDTIQLNERTITCDDGYYAIPPSTETITLEGSTPFFGCLPDCGNGQLDAGEECDAASVSTCETDCTCKMGFEPTTSQIDCHAICGNGVLDTSNGEECDGGASCGIDCKCNVDTIPDGSIGCVSSCGNGVLDGTEACDSSDPASGCTSICTCDGTHEPTVPKSTVCQLTCGNGELDGQEECDSDGAGCVNCFCTPRSTYEAINNITCGLICGNGKLDPLEQCDIDGGENCLAGCVCAPTYEAAGDINCRAICGNSRRDSGEACDAGGGANCKADCTCEAGYQSNDDPTKIDCQPVCGNARLDTGEQCDYNGGMYCNNDCTCFVGFEKSALPSTDCAQILGCDRFGTNNKTDHVFSCINGVNTRTITCDVGYYAVAPTTSAITLTAGAVFPGCFLIDQCSVYGFSGKSQNTKNCTGDVSQRTIYCADGYFVLPQGTTSVILGDGVNFTGCEEIRFCDQIAFACGQGLAVCTDAVGSRTCTCPPDYHIKSTYTQSKTYIGFVDWTPADDCQKNTGCALTPSNLAGCGVETYEGQSATCVATDPDPVGRICTCPGGYAVIGAGAATQTGVLEVGQKFVGCVKIDQCSVYGCNQTTTGATCDVGAFRDSRVCTCPPYSVNKGGPYFHAVILYHGLEFAGCRDMPGSVEEKAEDVSDYWEALAGALVAQFTWLEYFEVKESVSDGQTRIAVEFQVDTTAIGLSEAKKDMNLFISDWLGVRARLEELQGRRDGKEIFPATLALYVASTNAVVFSILVSVVAILMHLL